MEALVAFNHHHHHHEVNVFQACPRTKHGMVGCHHAPLSLHGLHVHEPMGIFKIYFLVGCSPADQWKITSYYWYSPTFLPWLWTPTNKNGLMPFSDLPTRSKSSRLTYNLHQDTDKRKRKEKGSFLLIFIYNPVLILSILEHFIICVP